MPAHLSLTGFAWKNLWRRRLRTSLTLCGIGMAVGAFVALVGFSRSFEHEWQKLYTTAGTDIAVVDKNFMNTAVNQNLEGKLRSVSVVDQAEPMIFNIMDIAPDTNSLMFGWLDDSYEFNALTFDSGSRFHDGKAELIMGSLLAKSQNKKVGDTLELEGTPFKVVGIYHGGTALEAGAIIMPLDQLQQLSSLQGKCSGFHVRLKPAPAGEAQDRYLKRAQLEIEKALPGLNAQPATDRASNNQFVGLAHAVAWGTSGIALLMGILGIANTMAMSVFERTREIGILRAIGWKAWRVMLLIQLEATSLGFVGGFIGIAFGWVGLWVLSQMPQTASIVSTSLSWDHMIESFLIALFSGIIAGAYPAWRGSHLSPVEALHHE